MNAVNRAATTLLAILVLLGLAASTSDAQITLMPPDKSTAKEYTGKWTWTRTGTMDEKDGPRGAPNWTIMVTSPKLGMGETDKKLLFEVTHLKPTQNGPFTIDAGTFPAKKKRACMLVRLHASGALSQRTDIYHCTVDASATPATIELTAKHLENDPNLLPQWSYQAPSKGILTVEASYDGAPNEQQFQGEVEPPISGATFTNEGKLKKSATGKKPVDYVVRFDIGGTLFSDTTLAFIEGNEGSFSKADLPLINRFFVKRRAYCAPSLFGTQDLFIAVDLTQWLSFFTDFDIGDGFEITDGTSEDLPGFLVSTSPITFDSTMGFVTATPFTGAVTVGGIIGGGNAKRALLHGSCGSP